MSVKKQILVLFIALSWTHISWGQSRTIDRPIGGSFSDFAESTSTSQDDFVDDPDTFGVFYFLAENPNQELPFADSLLIDFQQYDPVRQLELDYKNLGILGSAHQPFVYQPTIRKGFDVGLHQYDLYHTTTEQLLFYRLEKAYTNVAYYQGAEQADGFVTAKFSRNFANGLNFTLDYEKISYIGQRAQYPNQNSRNTALAMGMWYHSKKERYDGFFAYAANTIEQEDNGGLASEPQDEGEFDSPNSASVFLPNAQSRDAHREFSYTHYYKFGGQADSIRGFKRAYTISHKFLRKKSTYKFFNENMNNSSDTSYFNWFPHFNVNDQGMRHFLEHTKIENTFNLSTFKLDKRNTNENSARNQRDLLEVGVRHTYHKLFQEPRDSFLNNLFLTGKWNLNPGPRLRLNTYAHFGLLDNAGDYRINGELFFDFKKVGSLTLEANNQLYSPTLLQENFYLTQEKIWKRSFEKTLETNLSATYALPQFRLAVTGKYHLINNYIYFDTLGLSQQTGIPISITQLIIKKNFSAGKHIHLDNTVTLQNVSEDQIRLPSIFSKNSLYYSGKWFKVLQVHLGFDLRLNNSYFSDYYNPATGQFQIQNEQEVELYPALDAFLNMRVKTFRAYFKYENMSSLFIRDRLYYQSAFYAQPTAGFRFGIKWRFVN